MLALVVGPEEGISLGRLGELRIVGDRYELGVLEDKLVVELLEVGAKPGLVKLAEGPARRALLGAIDDRR